MYLCKGGRTVRICLADECIFPVLLYIKQSVHQYGKMLGVLTAIGLFNKMVVADVYLLCRIHFERL